MLFISPPFGNYFPQTNKNITTIRGSFTLNPRPGLLLSILKTLRYSPKYEGWVNKLGLKNKGIEYALKSQSNNNEVLSIAILKESEIKDLLKFCDLEWDEKCLNPHKNTKVVATASIAQVRTPVYNTSINKWKNVEDELKELKEIIR